MGDGSFYDWITDVEARQFQGYDKRCQLRSLNGRLMDVHEVCCSTATACASAPASEAAEIAYKEQQDFYVGHGGGYMIPIHSKLCQGTRIHFGKVLNEDGMRHPFLVHSSHE